MALPMARGRREPLQMALPTARRESLQVHPVCCSRRLAESVHSASTCERQTAGGLLIFSDGSWTFLSRPPASRPPNTVVQPLRGWRSLQPLYVVINPRCRPGGPFQEVLLNADRPATRLEDSVLLLPDLLSVSECSRLMDAADDWRQAHAAPYCVKGVTRVECHVDGTNLPGDIHALALVAIARALWSLEVLRPDVAQALFGQSSDLGDMSFKFSGHEPMINVYDVGGQFEPHEDGHHLTILVPLSSPCSQAGGGTFEGGGTGFWSEGVKRAQKQKWAEGQTADELPDGDPTVVLRPPAGTAMLWRGHLLHAALPVSAGRRHAFVCSFNLRCGV